MNIAQFITEFGDLAVTLPISVIVFVSLLRASDGRRLAVGWAIAVCFCGAAIGFLKIYFSTCATRLVDSPSGHVGMSTLVYGGLALMAARRWRRMAVPAMAAGAVTIAAIAVSRVVVGAHDTAEVLVGLAIGAMALGIFAEWLIRDFPAVPAKAMLVGVVLVMVLLHGQQVQAEQLIQAISGYLHAQHVIACF